MNALSGLAPVFILIVLGAVVRRRGLLTDSAAAGLNRVVANIALPALLVIKIGTADLATSFSLPLVAVTCGIVAATAFLVLMAASLAGVAREARGVLAQAAMRGNLAYVAFPVILGALGPVALQRAAVTSAIVIPLMNVLAVVVLELPRRERAASVARLLAGVAANPLVLGACAGMLLAAAHWRPWTWLASTLTVLSDFALPGALLALGAQLQLEGWARVWRGTAAATLIKVVLQPAAGLALLWLVGVRGEVLGVGVLLLAAPTAVASYPVAVELGGDADLAGAAVVVTTIAAMVTTVAWTVVLGLLT